MMGRHLKKKLVTSRLTDFRALVLHHVIVVLLLTHCCEGEFQVVGPSQPVVVTMGDDIVLPCHLKPAVDAVGMTLEWARPDLNPRFVHVWHEHQDLDTNQHSSYRGRTSLSVDKLKQGDVSLKLSNVKLSDGGTYRCYFPDLGQDSTVQLLVGTSSSQLVVSVVGIDRSVSGVELQCESAGWYPEPEVLWLDGEGNLLPAGPPETLRGPDDLYTVSSRVTVDKRHSNKFTCRVQQLRTNQSSETQIHVPEDFFVASCSSTACISISLVACFLSLLAAVLAVWKWRLNKGKNKLIEESENQLLMEKKNMKDTEEKLKRKEEEHKEMVDVLRKQEDELKKLIHQLKEQEVNLKDQLKENDEKLQEVEKDEKTPECAKLIEIISQYKWSLKDRLKIFNKLTVNTEKLLNSTEAVVLRATGSQKASDHQDEK